MVCSLISLEIQSLRPWVKFVWNSLCISIVTYFTILFQNACPRFVHVMSLYVIEVEKSFNQFPEVVCLSFKSLAKKDFIFVGGKESVFSSHGDKYFVVCCID